MNAILTDVDSSSDNQSENFTSGETWNFKTLTFVVKTESLEDLEKSEAS